MIRLDIVHPLYSLRVLEDIVVLSIKLLHHVRFKVLKEVDFGLHLGRVDSEFVAESLNAIGDIVDVTGDNLLDDEEKRMGKD
jgi:hypothetical protein